MAKVTLILEDVKEADGTDGLTIEWESGGEDFDADSVAHSYAHAFIQGISQNAETTEILDKNTMEALLPNRSEEDPTLN